MSSTTPARAHRAGSLVAAFGVLLGMFLVASPAQAAPVVNLSANDTTITLGESVTLSWTAADTTTLTAQDDWSGPKTPVASGSEIITPSQAGTFTYTLVAGNGEDPDSSDFVTVTVAPGPITPNPVTFPDECTVVIPTTANVTYSVDFGDNDTEELDAGTYQGLEFSFGDEVTFIAEANDGFTLANDAVASWKYTAPESCADSTQGPSLVTTKISCGSVTFTNTTDGPLDLQFVGFTDDDFDFDEIAQFTLAGGASRTVKTTFEEAAFAVWQEGDEEDEPTQVRFLEVPQDCGDSGVGDESGSGSGHPTVAPAAGIAAR